MPEAMTTPLILIEILALHLRFIEDNHTAVTHEMFGRIIDLLAMNNL